MGGGIDLRLNIRMFVELVEGVSYLGGTSVILEYLMLKRNDCSKLCVAIK